jgi:hypothetical protein
VGLGTVPHHQLRGVGDRGEGVGNVRDLSMGPHTQTRTCTGRTWHAPSPPDPEIPFFLLFARSCQSKGTTTALAPRGGGGGGGGGVGVVLGVGVNAPAPCSGALLQVAPVHRHPPCTQGTPGQRHCPRWLGPQTWTSGASARHYAPCARGGTWQSPAPRSTRLQQRTAPQRGCWLGRGWGGGEVVAGGEGWEGRREQQELSKKRANTVHALCLCWGEKGKGGEGEGGRKGGGRGEEGGRKGEEGGERGGALGTHSHSTSVCPQRDVRHRHTSAPSYRARDDHRTPTCAVVPCPRL